MATQENPLRPAEASLTSKDSESIQIRPMSSGAPLRRSPKQSDLSVGNPNGSLPEITITQPPLQDDAEGESQQQDENGSETSVKNNGEEEVVITEGETIISEVPEAFADPVSQIKESSIPSATPAQSNSTIAKESVVLTLSVAGSIQNEAIAGAGNKLSTAAELLDAMITLDIPTKGKAQAQKKSIGVPPPLRLSRSPSYSSYSSAVKTTKKGKKGKGDGGGDKHGSTATYETFPAFAPKGKNYQQEMPYPQQQYQDEQQAPQVIAGMGAISFKVPGRITHKTTIKIAHYPQAGNEIISVEQPSCPEGFGPCVEEFQFPQEINCDQVEFPNYSNNCNFSTYNYGTDQNAMMQQPHYPYYPYGGYGPY